MSLQVGDLVTVVVRNPVWPRRHAYASYVDIPEYYSYTGYLMRSEKRDPSGTFRISSDDPKYPVRMIDADRIEDVIINT